MVILHAQVTKAAMGMALAVALAGCASGGTASSSRNPGLVALPDVPDALIRMQHGSCPPERCPV